MLFQNHTPSTIPMYTAIHHDRRNSKVFLYYSDGARMAYESNHRLFTPNYGEYGSIDSGMTDIYGKPVYSAVVSGEKEMEIREINNGPDNQISECDIDYRTRFLQNHYKDVKELRFNIKDFSICFLDIEVESGNRFPTASRADRRVNCVTIYLSKPGKYITFGLQKPLKPETLVKIAEMNGEYRMFQTEKELITNLFTTIGESNVDIFSGYNCIAENEFLWLDNKIIPIKKASENDILFKYGKIDKKVNTGIKTGYKIKLSNGSEVITSKDHIFPIFFKESEKYKYPSSLQKNYKESKVHEIMDMMNSGKDIYFKQDLRKNLNKEYTYKEFILENIKELLDHPQFDMVIRDVDIRNKILKTECFKNKENKPVEYRGNTFYKRSSNFWSYKNFSDIISINELKGMINKYDNQIFLFGGNRSVELDITKNIDHEYLRLLGMIYTDGTWSTTKSNKSNHFILYNTNQGIISTYAKIINRFRKIPVNEFKRTKTGMSATDFTHRNSYFGLLIPFIYNNKMRKDLNIEHLSRLSEDQFFSFMSGCIDGDGSVTKEDNNLWFCNYNGDDLKKIQILLSWNGVFSILRSNSLRITRIIQNKHIYEKIKVSHNMKFNRLLNNIIPLHEPQNSPNKLLNRFIFDEYIILKIDSIEEVEQYNMYDLTTSSHFFSINGIKTHNCQFYDNPYLVNRAEQLGIDLRLLSRLPFKHRSAYVDKRDRSLKISGTEVIDYLILYKKFSNKEKDNYKLSTIGKAEVGEDKAPLPDGYQSYKNYWDDYVLYNIKDVELLVKIDAKRKMLESLIGACSEARIPFSHFFEAKKILVGFLMDFLHKRNMVVPPLKLREKKKFPGAAVFSTSGRYLGLVSYDYKSMYPSLIMGANISPEMKVEFDINYKLTPEEEKNLVKSPWTNWNTKQVYYRRDKEGIVPSVVRILFEGRDVLKKEMKRAKKEGRDNDAAYYGMKEQSYKLLGNSLYGLLGNEHFQLFDLDNAASVTGYGYLLITDTITDLSNYFENDFENDPRYLEAFKEKPTLNKKYLPKTTFSRGDTDETFNVPSRFSHGDTDSFFVKYDDIYSVYEKRVGKQVAVTVINNNKIILENIYKLPDGEQESKIDFNNQCKTYFPSWKDLEKDSKVKVFKDGMYSENNITVIYNRYCLTDYCRILDMVIMKDNLSEYMKKFSDKWNFIRNTLFLKREKCILKAIVAKKKKYICIVESNEDMKYPEPEFQTVGLEIIRSDTTPFSRERLLTLVKLLLHNLDKVDMRTKYMTAKREFFNLVKKKDVYSISKPSGVGSEPPQYTEMITWPIEKRKEVDWRLRSGSVWNHLIETDPVLSSMTLEPISDGTKAKFIDVHENKYGLNSIAYVGETCPPRLLELFNPDWNSQWDKTFGDKMGRLFEAVGWSKDFENDNRDFMASVF